MSEEQRTAQPPGKPAHYGGKITTTERDRGDTPRDMSGAESADPAVKKPDVENPSQLASEQFYAEHLGS